MTATARKTRLAATFNYAARHFDSEAMRFLPFCADRMALRLNPAPGSKVLDCATGTGAVAAAAAQALSAGGRVTGIDIAEDMLARAQAHLTKVGLQNVDLHTMDAEQLEFRADYFDYTLCSYAVAYLSDPLAALRGWARVTRPGGRIMIATLAQQAFHPFLDLLVEAFAGQGVDISGQLRGSVRRFGDADACAALLAGAGLRDMHFSEHQLGFHARRAEEWWSVVSFLILPALDMELSPELLDAVQAVHLPAVASAASDKGIWLDISTLFSVGTR